MTDQRKSEQRGTGRTGGISSPRGDETGERNQGADFGTSERATRGTNRDADRSGTSRNEGHGHPREERNRRGE